MKGRGHGAGDALFILWGGRLYFCGVPHEWAVRGILGPQGPGLEELRGGLEGSSRNAFGGLKGQLDYACHGDMMVSLVCSLDEDVYLRKFRGPDSFTSYRSRNVATVHHSRSFAMTKSGE